MPDTEPLSIRRFDHGRFLVKSERKGSTQWYLVAFDDPDFPEGRCECHDNRIRTQYPKRQGMTPVKAICKHVKGVIEAIRMAKELYEHIGAPFDPRCIPLHGENE